MFLNGIITSHPFLLPPQARGGIQQGDVLRNYPVKVLSGSLNAISLPGIEETQVRQSCRTGPLVSKRPRRAAQAPSSGRDAVHTPQITKNGTGLTRDTNAQTGALQEPSLSLRHRLSSGLKEDYGQQLTISSADFSFLQPC